MVSCPRRLSPPRVQFVATLTLCLLAVVLSSGQAGAQEPIGQTSASGGTGTPTAKSAAVQRGQFGWRTLGTGSRGRDVRILQSWLTRLGYRTTVDGRYGSGTKRTVMSFEADEKLKRDGKVSTSQARRIRRYIEKGGREPVGPQAEKVRETGTTMFQGSAREPELTYVADAPGGVTVEVTDADRGTAVARISDTAGAAGEERTVTWDTTISGKPAPEGVYAMRVASGAARATAGTEQFTLRHHVFPVRGGHDYGTATNEYGTARGRMHYGHDVFAECGVRLAAVAAGTVHYAGYQSSAGHYVVIDSAIDGQSSVYMHLRSPSRVQAGETVRTGETIGYVGESGNAVGCHVHFELWTSPGWYRGGKAYDPQPKLRDWDSWS
ncbi:MAG: peptidoglycan DD-metalloendopeptidase family protein [Solirubrobacterales bacterium]